MSLEEAKSNACEFYIDPLALQGGLLVQSSQLHLTASLESLKSLVLKVQKGL